MKALYGVIHLVPSLSYAAFPGVAEGLALLERDIEALLSGGADGILIENDCDKPHTLTVNEAQVAWLTRAAMLARSLTHKPVGIGVQRIDWKATLAIAAVAELNFVRLDVFVDTVRMQNEVVRISPEEVLAYRHQVRADHIGLWTDVHVKHAELLSTNTLGESVKQALSAGAETVLVSGKKTGEAPKIEDLHEASQSLIGTSLKADGAPPRIAIGSGLRPDNAQLLAPWVDAAVVGTVLKSGDRIDVARVTAMVDAWRAACAT
jgi:membrane complex biogenesis BtpA family protein